MSAGADDGARSGGAGPLAYVLVTVPSVERLGDVVAAVLGDDGPLVGVVDALVLERPAGQVTVVVREPSEVAQLERLAGACDRRVRFSAHDAELAGVTLEPGDVALLLLVEDGWARRLTTAAHAVGGRVGGAEWIAQAHAGAGASSVPVPVPVTVPTAVPVPAPTPVLDASRAGLPDLLARRPLTPDGAPDVVSMDQVEQLRTLAALVDSGVLDAAQYEIQRRRALDD